METIQQLKTARQLLQAAQFALNKIPNRRLAFGPYDQTYDLAAAIDQFFGDEPRSRLTAAESHELEMLSPCGHLVERAFW